MNADVEDGLVDTWREGENRTIEVALAFIGCMCKMMAGRRPAVWHREPSLAFCDDRRLK